VTRPILALALTLALAGCASAHTAADFSLLPAPRSLAPGKGDFEFGERTRVLVAGGSDAEVRRLAEFWAAPVRASTGWALPVETGPCAEGAVCLRADTDGPAEGYTLTVAGDSVVVAGHDHAGLFYGLQTLTQMLPAAGPDGSSAMELPAAAVTDAPRFAWRGMHLDVGRHFFGPDFVKRYIDALARYKINRFHWHLTEDQGWRIEIRGYPRLTEVGAWRKETMVEKNFDPYVGDGQRYGGFYTQDEVRDIVRYARERYVTIVPEIEMPGHSLAALAAYPELACTPGPFEVGTRWGVFEDIFCPKEETFTFLENVLTEVMELFPGEYIHIGGDEAPKARWERSDVAQAVIEREGLADEHELQSWFVRRIERFLNEHGRRLVGWDEIIEGGLAPNATVMSWRGTQGGIEAARQGHDVVMTPTSHLYFDYYQGEPEQEPLAIGGYTPLERVYDFEPVPEELGTDASRHVLGAQGNVWTEYMATPDHVEYMVFPRLLALSEVVWTNPDPRDFRDFARRLPAHLEHLDARGMRYRIPDVLGLERDRVTLDDEIEVPLVAASEGSIHYTLDGTEPLASSSRYTGPVKVDVEDGPVVVAARVVQRDGRAGPVRRASFARAVPRPAALVGAELEDGFNLDVYRGRIRRAAEVEERGELVRRDEVAEVALPAVAPDSVFGLRFRGYLSVPDDGVYTFRLTADDGAVMRFGGTVVLDNDGPHGPVAKTADVALAEGLHPFDVLYFQTGGGQALKLETLTEEGTFGPLPAGSVLRVR
jgi:hexosaminidase